MILTIIEAVIIGALIGFNIYLYQRQNRAFDQIAKLVVELMENDRKIESIDQSTGADIFRLKSDFEKFKTEYGDAAVEEMRQAANREKAWAEGINEIMSYGARFQGRGDST